MSLFRINVLCLACVLWVCALGACEKKPRKPPPDRVVLGQTVSGSTLKRGEFAYFRWCAGCHGPDGRGGGARSATMTPRNLVSDPMKHGVVSVDHYRRVITAGIDGTDMKAVPVPASDLDALVWFALSLREADQRQ